MIKKHFLIFLMLILLVLGFSGCYENDECLLKGEGEIKYIEIEGGFFGIISDDGEYFDPINLESEFQIDGLRVKFLLKKLENQTSIHMWGTIVEIIEINKL